MYMHHPRCQTLDQILGLVKEGKFFPFDERAEIELETIAMQEATSPLPLDDKIRRKGHHG